MQVNRMTLRNVGNGNYRVNFIEARDDKAAHETDDLEDAVLTGAAMRRRRDAKLRSVVA
jgi:hypothetical protein